MKLEELQAILSVANIKATGMNQIVNPYWPASAEYDDMRQQYPWWAVHVAEGTITIGWRKRVICIDWSMTNRRGLVTKDDVTKDDTLVHAWSKVKAVEYLSAWPVLPLVDITEGPHRQYLLQGREKTIEALRMFGDGSQNLDLIKNLLDEVKDEASVVASVRRVGDNGHSFSIRIGNTTIHHYPRGE